nr:hypothetical protein [Bacteroidales bacterium]
MKKILMTITLAFAMAAGVLAQDTTARGYRSFFGSESTEWHVAEEVLDVGTFDYKYSIGDDTVISGLKYRKLEARWVICTPSNTYEEQDIDYSLSGFVREDTTEGKLWVRNAGTGNEDCLAVDMSLSVGDTFWYSDYWLEVENVYTDYLGRKVVDLGDYYGRVLFIEGVGATMWHCLGASLYSLYSMTYCIFHDDTLTYRNGDVLMQYGDIFFDTVHCWGGYRTWGIDVPKEKGGAVYPNPCVSSISMELLEGAQLTVYDAWGHVQYSKKYG